MRSYCSRSARSFSSTARRTMSLTCSIEKSASPVCGSMRCGCLNVALRSAPAELGPAPARTRWAGRTCGDERGAPQAAGKAAEKEKTRAGGGPLAMRGLAAGIGGSGSLSDPAGWHKRANGRPRRDARTSIRHHEGRAAGARGCNRFSVRPRALGGGRRRLGKLPAVGRTARHHHRHLSRLLARSLRHQHRRAHSQGATRPQRTRSVPEVCPKRRAFSVFEDEKRTQRVESE